MVSCKIFVTFQFFHQASSSEVMCFCSLVWWISRRSIFCKVVPDRCAS